MTTAITVSPWLGIRKDPWAQEKFPKGTVNFKQLRTLLNMEDKGRVMVDLDLDPAILKITDEIVEVHTRFGQPRQRFASEPTYIWLNTDGKVLCAVIEKYEGPQGLHKPGDTFRKWAIAYLRHPDMSNFEEAKVMEF